MNGLKRLHLWRMCIVVLRYDIYLWSNTRPAIFWSNEQSTSVISMEDWAMLTKHALSYDVFGSEDQSSSQDSESRRCTDRRSWPWLWRTLFGPERVPWCSSRQLTSDGILNQDRIEDPNLRTIGQAFLESQRRKVSKINNILLVCMLAFVLWKSYVTGWCIVIHFIQLQPVKPPGIL